MNFSSDWNQLIGAFLKHKVSFVLVGGHAVSAYGYPRSTEDIDLFIDSTEENAAKLVTALHDFFEGDVGFKIEQFIEPNKVVMFGVKPFRVDILTSIEGVSFAEAFNGHQEIKVGDHLLPVIGLRELLINKRATGRAKDLGDVEELDKIAKLKTKEQG